MVRRTISHYEIFEKLGEGGMGVVYKAHDVRLRRDVAIKFLPSELERDEGRLARFYVEARAASSLSHANVATIYEIDESGGEHFIAMEYIQGTTLRERIGAELLSIDSTLDLAIQIARGLYAAHQKKIVHRDVKPENIMITMEGNAKIMDFGLAKVTRGTRLTGAGATMGTVAYMSPEQVRGEDVDERSDIWAFGVVLFEMLTQRVPFKGEHPPAIMYEITNKDVPVVRELRKDIPPILESIVVKALAKNPQERYQHLGQVIADLETVKKGGAPTATVMLDPVRHSKFRWLIVGTVVILFAAIWFFFRPTSVSLRMNGTTIAVLPFSNMGGNQETEYFSDGVTEDVLTRLGQINSFKVISRTTMMQYKGTKKTMREIGNDLHAGVVLEGSVRRDADQVRITVQLIDANTDEHIWAQTYDRKFKDIFVIQSSVAQDVAIALQTTLSSEEIKKVDSKPTDNLSAYDEYLMGRYSWSKRLPDKLKNGIVHFERAIAEDSNYAIAYAGLADSYTILGNLNLLPPNETYPRAKLAAWKALTIDSNLAEAHASLGFAVMNYDWDWNLAEKELKRAIEINPNFATARSWYAYLLTVTGRFEEATVVRKKALELDPLSPVINADMGLTLYFARKYDEAVQQYIKTLEIDPTFVIANIPLAGAYVQKGLYNEAIAAIQQVTVGMSYASVRHPIPIAALGNAYAASGRKDDAQNMLELLEEMSETQYVSPYWMGVLVAGLGRKDQALSWLAKGIEQHDGSMILLKVDPVFDNIRSSPRFVALLKRIGLQ